DSRPVPMKRRKIRLRAVCILLPPDARTVFKRETPTMTGNHTRVKANDHIGYCAIPDIGHSRTSRATVTHNVTGHAKFRAAGRAPRYCDALFGGEAAGLGEFLDRDAPVDTILLRRVITGGLVIGTAI